MCGEPDKQKPTAEERALSKVAYQEWQIQKEYFAPVQDTYMENVEKTGTDTYKNSVVNAAGNATATNVAEQTGNGITQATMTGVDPTSGRFNSQSKALKMAASLNVSEAMVHGNVNAEANYIQGESGVVAMGQGKSMQAQAGITALAMDATRDEMSRVQTSFNNKNDTLNAAVKVGGVVAASDYWDKPPATNTEAVVE